MMNEVLEQLNKIISIYNEYVGGYLIVAFLVPIGLYFTIRMKFLQIRNFVHSWKITLGFYDNPKDTGDVNHLRALTSALASTVGTGNIVGVSLAIYFGGPGALFWIWVTGFLGMMLKMVECTLSLKYRIINEDGTVSGGPMFYIERGLYKFIGKWAKVLAIIFSVALILCSLGTGNLAQANGISDVMKTNYNIPPYITGLILSSIVLIIIVGGIKRIAEVAVRLVPFMAFTYIISALLIIAAHYKDFIPSLWLIVKCGLTGTDSVASFGGATLFWTIVWGVRRGLFSNEAGQGSAPIVHAAAKTKIPLREGFVASLEPFIDTIVICTMTALVIIVTGFWHSGIKGVGMTIAAFNEGFSRLNLPPIGQHIVGIGLFLFAFTTIIGWSYYGSRGIQYILGYRYIKYYYFIFALFTFFGCVWGIDLVWNFVDMVITFMTIPNLIALLFLFPEFVKEVKSYESNNLKNFKE
ncbi:MAG: sodium:alanine symporter family protein [Bacteroidales bacterium]|nr:sodium:alanine symporter family protein [Bacteroidales bacterium]